MLKCAFTSPGSLVHAVDHSQEGIYYMKICISFCPPLFFPEFRVHDIGVWFYVMQGMVLLATPINCFISSKQFIHFWLYTGDLSSGYDLVMGVLKVVVFGSEFLLLLVLWFYSIMKTVRQAIPRQKYQLSEEGAHSVSQPSPPTQLESQLSKTASLQSHAMSNVQTVRTGQLSKQPYNILFLLSFSTYPLPAFSYIRS